MFSVFIRVRRGECQEPAEQDLEPFSEADYGGAESGGEERNPPDQSGEKGGHQCHTRTVKLRSGRAARGR